MGYTTRSVLFGLRLIIVYVLLSGNQFLIKLVNSQFPWKIDTFLHAT